MNNVEHSASFKFFKVFKSFKIEFKDFNCQSSK